MAQGSTIYRSTTTLLELTEKLPKSCLMIIPIRQSSIYFKMCNPPEVQLLETFDTFSKGLEVIQSRMITLLYNVDVIPRFYVRLELLTKAVEPNCTADGKSNLEEQNKNNFKKLLDSFEQMEKNSFHRGLPLFIS